MLGSLASTYTVIGHTADDGTFRYRETALPIDEALAAWKGTLERVFKTESGLPTIGGGLDLDGNPTDGPTADCWQERMIRIGFRRPTVPIAPIRSMYAAIKWRVRGYLFRYSRVQTVSMTVQGHSNVQGQM